ncbi:glutathione S-transferase domain-containing protein [Colletotrichum navitas]|uniref:Glutathione S-transferase domain-containing protein n=1 Tax=Colletotrichum navitas TaxID=681940 RepID=A0AAD8V4G2_9PEZI|nr:glutathione S-transferase domain-containing protein [Colletotrichum navitas]KAK1590372.1 glutathione S-transferase domain-containing protein [Colletotrichum navitas]
MSIEVFHMRLSQSERIVWLLEELQVPYDLHVCDRDPNSALAPKEIKDVNPAGTAPYFRDTTVSPPVGISESGATVEYILAVHGSKTGSGAPRLRRTPDDADYASYLEWFHFANGTLQPAILRGMTLLFAGASESGIAKRTDAKMHSCLKLVDDRLANNKWLAGQNLSAADIMIVFSLTTMRGFYPLVDLSQYGNILRYLKDVAERPAYREALKKAEEGMEPMIGPKVKAFKQFPAFGAIYEPLGY